VRFYNSTFWSIRIKSIKIDGALSRFFFFFFFKESCYKLQTMLGDAKSEMFFFFLEVSEREIEDYNTYEAGIIHRIGTKCLFTSSFELSKLGTISDLRLGSREVPRVRSVIYVSPSPKRDPRRSGYVQPLFADQALTPHFNHYFW